MEVLNPIVRRWREDAERDWEGFWGRAAEQLPWFRKWDRVFEWDPPGFKWYTGAQTNLSYNCLDRHVAAGRAGHAALIGITERGEQRVFTYAQLLSGTKRVAAALRGLGVRRGDRVAIYMPTGPEAIMAMLACTRIGAIHIVVFAGFGASALAERIRLAGARVLLTADVTYRKGNAVRLWGIVKDALSAPDSPVEKVVVLRRTDTPIDLRPGRDMTWDEFLAQGEGQPADHEVMEANEPAFILATSGTTAKPKLAVHVHGGYQVGIYSTAAWCFGMKPEDVWWSTSDIGWIVGHSYIVYAPLLFGTTTIAYEGALDHPGPETFYRIVQEHHVTGIFTAPTAVRMLMRYGTAVSERFDLSSVERVVCAGEVLNVPAWQWLQKEVFRDRIPVIDHMWQTETGGPVFGNPYGLAMLPIKPGSAGIPLPGYFAEVRSMEGEKLPPGEKGIVVFTRPFPSLTPTIWGDPDRYNWEYWQRIPGVYFTGDAAYVDEDGYFWFSGRADEVIKIAGHRIGTIEVETALLTHPAVAEAGVTGRPDELRGEVISAFVVLKAGYSASEELRRELFDTVRRELGPVAVVGEIHFVNVLPKTRSGKIMRRVFKAVILDRDPGDISTIEDEGSVEEARQAWREMRAQIRGAAD
ncbi:acetate--CoA ligase [Caldinitratiruptor microaerophilus]|uniref:Acetyl-CoA synthetase n=1 Tax=Caldinitratiruptor microaerophilus TaxID=671077 RepID=A0AA35CMU6_9FIRM|nr:acetate--CoA ligase [Caldinitratiruptor microaerophilus]BDG62087.1 acetyl-CoA synthetase [Caldinitratiruptor microaerophilus]